MDTEQPTIGPKPAGGLSGSPLQDAGKLYTYDSTGRIKEVRGTSGPLSDATYNANLLDPSARIGDYVIQKGQPTVVPNSPTDLAQRYKIAIGGTESPESGFNLKNEALSVAGPTAAGALIGGPVGAVVGALAGAVMGTMTYSATREDALKRWQEQNVKYDSAVEFFRDDDGTLKYKLDYQKMGTGGPRSGEGVKEAQNRETKVELGDDGRLKIQVSPIYAETSSFKNIVENISKNYGGLSKDTENLNQILDEIENGIDGEAKSFVSNMMLYADYANRFPEASPETVIASYTTEAAGYVAPDEMSKIQVSILDGKEVSTKTAQEFFDSVLGMSKKERNELIKGLVEIISGDADGYTDNQRAVAYGEYQSLFAASANTENYDDDKYQGMLDANKIVSFINDFDPLGVDVSDALALISGGTYSKQEYLTQDEGAGFLGGLAGIAASFGLWKGGTKLVGNLLKRAPGTAQLFKNSISGRGRLALRSAIAKGEMGTAAKMWGADVAFNAIKIGTFDAALAGIQSGVSGTDFWSEFGQDFARDVALEALFSYYDLVQYQKYVTDDNVWLYANKDTGQLERSNVDKGMTYSGYEITDDGLVTNVEYEQVAKVNVGPDLQGNLVGVIKTPQGGTLEIVNGVGTYTPSEGNVVEGIVETAPAEEMAGLMSGVIVESPVNDVSTVMQSLVKDGMSTDVEGVLLSSQAADSAIVAGKVAKAMGTKAGLQTYKQLFNKNAVLDYANNLALAKTGDQNAWRAAQEKFVSVTNNAESELNNIQSGVYIKEAAKEWEKTIEIIGGFNYQYKYKPKVDGAYINAINQLQRAQLLNDTRPEGDTTDYVAKALEKYGDAISKMPQDRAEALQKWLEQGKKWIKVFNRSVKKSGKVDLKKLESFTDTDIEEKIGYFPVWAKRTTYKGLLDRFYGISQTRNPYKEWLRNGEWVPLDELEDPYMAMTRYMNFMANNMGLNDMQEAAATVYDAAGLLIDNTPTTATIRKKKLESIKNKDELTKKLDEMVEAKKKEVEAKTLTPKQYADAMTKLYEDSAIEETTEALSQEPKNWDDFWKSAPAQTRKDIRNELEKTSLQTGYGISDTRARLNAQVPGADVLDWSLLGRDHTNGLVSGGLYAGEGKEVKAYILDLDSLRKLTGLNKNLEDLNQHSVNKIKKHINVKDGIGIIPIHFNLNSSKNHMFYPEIRWGHSGDNYNDWETFFNYLASENITKIPVAIVHDGVDNLQLADVVEEKLGYAPQDITADVQQAFSEYGQIPLFRGQRGLGEFNMNDLSPTGQVGDAYWIAPNASYTDEYGKDKIMGTIPVKYFMSDKEKNELVGKLRKELLSLDRNVLPTVEKKYSELKKWLMDETYKGETVEAKKTREDYENDTIAFVEIEPVMAYGILRSDGYTDAQKKKAAEFLVSQKYIDDKPVFESELEKLPKNKFWKDVKKAAELKKIVDSVPYEPMSGNFRDKIVSYRALAEYTGKPIIDISEDGFADGTAFFYYKGIDPKFDEEIGKQLETQAKGTPQWPEDEAYNAFEEWADNNPVRDIIDIIAERAPETKTTMESLKTWIEEVASNKALSPEQRNNIVGATFRAPMEALENRPGLQKLLDLVGARIQGDVTSVDSLLDASLNDLGRRHIKDFFSSDEIASILDEIGINPMSAPGEENKAAWDAIDPTSFANVPTEPQFKQPRRVTYEDYERGVQADPDMPARIQSSYRAAMANRLIKEATRVVGLAEDYLSEYGYGADWQSYLNTSLIPDLQNAINQRMLPDELQSFVQARMVQAIQDVAPYQAPELILKSQLENVAQEWRDWAIKHIKAGRFTQGELKEFVGSHNLDLPNDKRPYPSKVKHALWQMLQDGKRIPKIEGLSTKVSKDMAKEDFYKMLDETPLFRSTIKDKNELVDLVAAEKNGETTDGYTMGVAATAVGLGRRTPVTWYKNGKPYTRFVKTETKEQKMVADETLALFNDKELVKEEGLISRFVSGSANLFRLFTTGWDPARVFPNLTRDTTRSFTIGERFINAKNTLQLAIEQGNYSDKQKEILGQAIENAANSALGSTYNTAYRTPRANQTSITKEYLSQNGASPMKRFTYNLVHDKRSIAEFPMEFFEGYSRRNNARSLAAVQLGKDQAAGLSFEAQVKNAVDAATFAGREYTANFQRKGKFIGAVSKYVAYQSSAYAGLDGMLRAFIDNPKLVTRNFAVFVIAYLILLADTLSREKTRNQYYRLSEYDRENQIVVSMGDSILTIPMDQELAGLLFPYRRIMETLNGTDPVSFFEFVWGTFTEWMPMDLSGFSEGDSFNLSRGLEKLTAQNMPTGLTPIQEAVTGYDLYYGSDISVTDEELRNYGIYKPEAGDYTTTSKDSLFLRNVANATGIPQWQLQVMWEGYGGNVGKYVLNIIDKAAGATKEQQGGKDFADTVFNSFTALDQDNATSVFYDGIKQLGQEKNALIQKIADYNEDLKVASGSAKVNLQNKIYEAKQEYAIKVGDFVDKYVSAYDITGGLPKKQAQQIYYLFRLDDDNTLYESGSPEEYYSNQAKQKFKNQATALSAPILDNYYNNRIGNIYQDADGVWRRYLSGGAQAMRNSIYGHGEQQMVDLLNILEDKNTGLANLRSQVKKARSAAYEAGDWDTRDALGYEFDKKVIEAISPYIEHYGAENVLGNTQVLDYLADWFFVPNDFKRTKRGGYVSLAHNAQTDEAFVRPYIKYVFGLPTNYSSYTDTKFNSLELGE